MSGAFSRLPGQGIFLRRFAAFTADQAGAGVTLESHSSVVLHLPQVKGSQKTGDHKS